MLNPNPVKPVVRKPPLILPDQDERPYDDAGVSMKPPLILPGQDDLPCDDGVPMETQRHLLQMNLLLEPLVPWLAQRQDGYAGGNMFLYFSPAQVFNQDFRGPDVFVALNVPKGERKSWVVWEEGKGPDVVIELLSETTASEDKNAKKVAYQNQVRVPEYFWYDPYDPKDWAGFALRNGIYQPLLPNARNHFISKRLNLALVRWRGVYSGVDATWLRWATLDGEVLMTNEEKTEQEKQQKEQEKQRADQAERKEKQAENKAEQERQRAEQEKQQKEQEKKRAEKERQRAEKEKKQKEQEKKRAEKEKKRAEKAKRKEKQAENKAEQERQRAEQEKQRAEQAKRKEKQAENKAEQEKKRADQEKKRAERLVAQLRAMGVDPDKLK